MTKPPFVPIYAALINGSDATFSPTCFMLTAERRPEILPANAISKATFSFMAHWACMGMDRWSFWDITDARISEAGVPGYDAATTHPFSRSPRAMASFPSMRVGVVK
jgi:hypothetical protein